MTNTRFLLITATLVLAVPSVAGSVTSADIIEYESEGSDFFDGPIVLLSTTSNYDTNEFHFQLDNQDYEQIGVDGEAHDEVTVEITNQNTEAIYSLRDTGLQSIYRFEPVEERLDINEFDSKEQIIQTIETSHLQDTCYDISGDGTFNGEDYYATDAWTWTGRKVDVYCVKAGKPLGSVGEISSSPRDVFETKWEVRNDRGMIEQATISNGDMGPSVTQQLGPNIKVMFTGAASTGRNSPVPTDELILHNNRDGFKIIQRGDYQTYTSNIDDLIFNLEKWGKGQLQRDNVVQSINSDAIDTASEHTSSEFQAGNDPDGDGTSEVAGYSFSGSSIQSGELRLAIDGLMYPEFTVAARACRHSPGDTCNAFIQIEKTVGKPDIVSSDGASFSELQTGEVSVTYRNVGNAEGSFEARVTQCGGQFTVSGLANKATLIPGESTTAQFPISFSSTDTSRTEFSDQCTLQVKETTTGETVATTVSVEASQKQECTPGEKFRDWEVVEEDGQNVKQYTVYQCNSKGTQAEPVKTCDPGEVAEPQADGSYSCAVDGSDDDDDDNTGSCDPIVLINNPAGNDLTLPNIPCQVNKAVSGTWGLLKTAAAGFAFLVGFGLRVPAMQMAKLSSATIRVLDRRIKLGWIIGLIFGGLLAWATLTFLSNPAIKWTVIILGALGTLLYIYVFSFRDLLKALLPIG